MAVLDMKNNRYFLNNFVFGNKVIYVDDSFINDIFAFSNFTISLLYQFCNDAFSLQSSALVLVGF